ncbi:MAG TPA: gamma-glutamyltransferase, partial [Emcibacteraceae bacterium]|nr:gamma-glutamyltransferase [Emcibacteraceae bacterium]
MIKSNKSLFNKMLNGLLSVSILSVLLSCSSGGQTEWPKMEADNLWSELENKRTADTQTAQQIVEEDKGSSLPASPIAEKPVSLLDIRVSLQEIERDLPFRAENIAKAMDQYEAADNADRAMRWRGVEIEISRLNELAAKLRTISRQIEGNEQADQEIKLTNRLAKRIDEIIPATPDSLDLAVMQQAEGTDRSSYDNQMVVAANPYAAKAGLEILKKGGSAVDAAIAVETVLSLVEPQSSGIGGGAFLLHFDPSKPSNEQLNFYDGREAAPMAATPDLFKSVTDVSGYVKLDAIYGGLSVGVPGALAALKMAHDRHGVLPWAEVFEPA